jgi:multicomponent K+:H+ antiporter subunit A
VATVLGLIVLLPFLASVCAAFLPARARNAAAWLAGLTSLACVVLVAGLYREVASGEVVRLILPWMPQFGLELSFRLDG